jgi:hypothetical protein
MKIASPVGNWNARRASSEMFASTSCSPSVKRWDSVSPRKMPKSK